MLVALFPRTCVYHPEVCPFPGLFFSLLASFLEVSPRPPSCLSLRLLRLFLAAIFLRVVVLCGPGLLTLVRTPPFLRTAYFPSQQLGERLSLIPLLLVTGGSS